MTRTSARSEPSLFAAHTSDPESLQAAVAGAEAILHLATRIPPTSDARQRAAWSENDRVRAEGTQSLVDAGIASGIDSFIRLSFAYG